jgi:hypothetical protein
MFLKHLKGQILKRRYAQGWGFVRSTSLNKTIFKRRFALTLWGKNYLFTASFQGEQPVSQRGETFFKREIK